MWWRTIGRIPLWDALLFYITLRTTFGAGNIILCLQRRKMNQFYVYEWFIVETEEVIRNTLN